MKIYNNMNITYSAIEQNSRKNTKQNIPESITRFFPPIFYVFACDSTLDKAI